MRRRRTRRARPSLVEGRAAVLQSDRRAQRFSSFCLIWAPGSSQSARTDSGPLKSGPPAPDELNAMSVAYNRGRLVGTRLAAAVATAGETGGRGSLETTRRRAIRPRVAISLPTRLEVALRPAPLPRLVSDARPAGAEEAKAGSCGHREAAGGREAGPCRRSRAPAADTSARERQLTVTAALRRDLEQLGQPLAGSALAAARRARRSAPRPVAAPRPPPRARGTRGRPGPRAEEHARSERGLATGAAAADTGSSDRRPRPLAQPPGRTRGRRRLGRGLRGGALPGP